MKRVAPIFLLLALALFALAGCSDDAKGEGDPLLGTWNVSGIEKDGEEYLAGDAPDGTQSTDLSFAFKAGGKVTGVLQSLDVDGTYTREGNTVTAVFGNERFEFDFTDGMLRLYEESTGATVIFSK